MRRVNALSKPEVYIYKYIYKTAYINISLNNKPKKNIFSLKRKKVK